MKSAAWGACLTICTAPTDRQTNKQTNKARTSLGSAKSARLFVAVYVWNPVFIRFLFVQKLQKFSLSSFNRRNSHFTKSLNTSFCNVLSCGRDLFDFCLSFITITRKKNYTQRFADCYPFASHVKPLKHNETH